MELSENILNKIKVLAIDLNSQLGYTLLSWYWAEEGAERKLKLIK